MTDRVPDMPLATAFKVVRAFELHMSRVALAGIKEDTPCKEELTKALQVIQFIGHTHTT